MPSCESTGRSEDLNPIIDCWQPPDTEEINTGTSSMRYDILSYWRDVTKPSFQYRTHSFSHDKMTIKIREDVS